MTVQTVKNARVDWAAIWAGVRERLRRELGEAIFEAWIAPLSLERADENGVFIAATKPFARNWVANHYSVRIDRAFQAEGAEPATISIVLGAVKPASATAERTAAAPIPSAPIPSANVSYIFPDAAENRTGKDNAKAVWNRMLHPAQTFDSFICGPANEFGYRAARDFAETEHSDVPLLYIHGGFGFGKTHLLNASALEFRRRGKRALFLRAEDFMRHFLGALYRKDTFAFKDELRTAEILVLDDLQHICRSSTTSAELLHTVNALADLRRRVVIAADRPPAALDGLGADIRSRLSGGLVIALDKPDRATRLAILEARAADFRRLRPEVCMPREVLERIADMSDASPREFIGVFTKLATYCDLTKKPVTADMVDGAVGLRPPGGGKTSIDDIQRKTAEFYKLEVRDFHSPQRARRVARPRQVAMYLARKLTTRSLPEIGRRFGGRDHTTVLHACRRIEELCADDPAFQQEVDFLQRLLSREIGH